jgi:hypothetical protein
MPRNAGLCLSLCMLVACGTGTDSHPIDLKRGWPAVELNEAFDRAAHLAPLSTGAEPELRVWNTPFIGNITGHAISSGRTLKCSARYRNDGLTASVDQADCVMSDMPVETRRSVLDLMPALSALNGRTWGCALGGETFFVEGFVNGRRFAFIVSNPAQCQDPDSLLVKRLVEVLRSKRASTNPADQGKLLQPR